MNRKSIGWMVGILGLSMGTVYSWQSHQASLRMQALERQSMGIPLLTYPASSSTMSPSSGPFTPGQLPTCADMPKTPGFGLGKAMTPADADSMQSGPPYNSELRMNADWTALKSRMRPGDMVRGWGIEGSNTGFGGAGGVALFRGPCFIGDVLIWISLATPPRKSDQNLSFA